MVATQTSERTGAAVKAGAARKPEKLNILFLTKMFPFPPAYAGDAVYSRGLISSLAKLANVTALCAGNGEIESTRLRKENLDWEVLGAERPNGMFSLFSRYPNISWRFASRKFSSALRSLLNRDWHAIVIDNLGMGHALEEVLRFKTGSPSTRLVYVSHEFEFATRSKKYASYGLNPITKLASLLDLEKVRKLEEALITSCDIVTVINENEIPAFKQICDRPKFLLLTPGYSEAILPPRDITSATPRDVLMLGGRRSMQKQKVLIDWLHVAARPLSEKGIGIIVAGDMGDDLKQRMQRDFPQVENVGFVEDLAHLASRVRMGIVADTMGGGFKLRLLSHVFSRIPLAGLNEAISGLPAKAGEGYLATQTIEGLVSLVINKIDDLEALNSLQKKCFESCLGEFSWEARAEVLNRAMQSDSSASTELK